MRRKGTKRAIMAAVLAGLVCTACQQEGSLEAKTAKNEGEQEVTQKASYMIKQTTETQLVNEQEYPVLETEVKIGILSDEYYNHNESVIAELQSILNELGETIEIDVASVSEPNSAKSIAAVKALIANGSQVVVIPNDSYQTDIESLVQTYPDVLFITFDYFINQGNVLGIQFKEELGAYLAGVLAASQTQTKQISFLGVEEEKDLGYQQAFVEGVKATNESVMVTTREISKDTSEDEVAIIVNELYGSGTDIIFELVGSKQLAVIEAAKEYAKTSGPVYIINSNQDLNELGISQSEQSIVLGTVVKQIAPAIRSVLESIQQEQLLGGRQMILSLDNNGVDLIINHPVVNQEIIELLEETKVAIIDGDLIPVINQ